jgi:hypothetical protein
VNFVDPRGTNRLMCDVYTDYGCAGTPVGGISYQMGTFFAFYGYGEGDGVSLA